MHLSITEEEGIKKRIKVYEEQLETIFTDLENKIVLLFQLMEEKNEKIASLESSLKESSELIKTAFFKPIMKMMHWKIL